ncbi:MAG: ribonuclease P protein component [Pseudomonadota bacterium]
MAGTLARLKRRPDFLKVASARQKWVAPGLIVQARRRPGAEAPNTKDPAASCEGTPGGVTSAPGLLVGRPSCECMPTGMTPPGEERASDKPGDARRGGKRMDPSLARVGFTVSGKVGNAVARNRARRRLKAALASLDAKNVAGGVDLVVIGRTETLVRPFPDLVGDLVAAFKRLGVWQEGAPPALNRAKD